MTSSAEAYILLKIAELAKRYGMRPSEADADISLVFDESYPDGHYRISFGGMTTEKLDSFFKMFDALGGNKQGVVVADDLCDLEDIVEQALSRAPSARRR